MIRMDWKNNASITIFMLPTLNSINSKCIKTKSVITLYYFLKKLHVYVKFHPEEQTLCLKRLQLKQQLLKKMTILLHEDQF